jgi:hypothetical protein
MKPALPALAAAFTLAACESDTTTTLRPDTSTPDVSAPRADATSTDATSTADTAAPRPDTGGIDPRPGCSRVGWAPEGLVAATSMGENDALDFGFVESYLTNPASETDPLTVLYVELYYTLGAETGPFVFTFAGENYKDCAVCGLIYTNCDADGACEKAFLVESGTLEITTNGGKTGQLTGALRDARFVEVTIAEDYTSTLVTGGETWCVDSYPFDAALTYVPVEGE